jgi:glucose-1-phosphate cytidylyltransferase
VGRDLAAGEPFCFTYGDGVANIDLTAQIACAARTARRPPSPGRFGALELDGGHVTDFLEKPPGDGGRINGGFFVLDLSVLDLIDGPASTWEVKPMETLARRGELMALRHDGFWGAMDTVRDKLVLEGLWERGEAPWKRW